jgi:dolichyl-phosphate-mannose--protein O-mannosyl transferase
MTQALQTIRHTPTMRLLVWTLCVFPLGYSFEFLSWLALGRSHFAYQFFEVLGAIYGWTVISALWAFLIIGPFRPYTEFSVRGECRQRARIFFVALSVLLALFVIWGIAIGLRI